MHLAVLLVAVAAPPLPGQEAPDSAVYEHRPLLVRVPGAAFALGAPRPIATLAGEELTRGRAGLFLEEAVQALPGVQIQNRYNPAVGERLTVRGFGGRAQFGVRGVRVLVDGVPATLADGQTTLDHVDVATLGRVEVLRGPAASLYGNAAGGVLHFRTREPPQAPLRPELLAVSGSDGLLHVRGTVGGRSGDSGYLLSAARASYDGFRRDPLADDGRTYGAAERSSVNGTLYVPAGPGRLHVAVNWVDLAAENPGSLSQALLDEGDRQAFLNNVRQGTRKDVRQAQLGLSWDGVLGGARVEAAGYGLTRTLENPIPSDIIAVERGAFGGRALVEAPGRVAGLELAVGGGVEMDVQRDDRHNHANIAGSRGPLRLEQLERVRSAGSFGYVRLGLSPRVDVSAGVRYDHFDFRVEDRFLDDETDDSGARSMDAVSPSLGVSWRPLERVELFGAVSSSFETPSTTELANRPDGAGGFNPELTPQRGTTAEGGVRTRLARALFMEATAHRTLLRGELVPYEVQGVAGRTFYRNAGRSEHRGLEVAGAWRGAGPLSARIAWSWLDAAFRSYSRGDAVYDGNRIPGLAPHVVDAVVRAGQDAWFAEVRGQYRGAVPADDANTAEAPDHLLFDVRAGSASLRLGTLEIAPFAGISNLFDRHYVAAVTVNAFGGRFFEPGPGRTFHAGIRAGLGVRQGFRRRR